MSFLGDWFKDLCCGARDGSKMTTPNMEPTQRTPQDYSHPQGSPGYNGDSPGNELKYASKHFQTNEVTLSNSKFSSEQLDRVKKRQQKRDKDKYQRPWTTEEDKILLETVKQSPDAGWKAISRYLSNRKAAECSSRWKELQPKQQRRAWSDEEDRKVIELVKAYGTNWAGIASHLSNRSGKQVRDRYLNNLDPEINRSKWTDEEDMIIVLEYNRIGARWAEISKQLKRRPENSVKNRFYSSISKRFSLNAGKMECPRDWFNNQYSDMHTNSSTSPEHIPSTLSRDSPNRQRNDIDGLIESHEHNMNGGQVMKTQSPPPPIIQNPSFGPIRMGSQELDMILAPFYEKTPASNYQEQPNVRDPLCESISPYLQFSNHSQHNGDMRADGHLIQQNRQLQPEDLIGDLPEDNNGNGNGYEHYDNGQRASEFGGQLHPQCEQMRFGEDSPYQIAEQQTYSHHSISEQPMNPIASEKVEAFQKLYKHEEELRAMLNKIQEELAAIQNEAQVLRANGH